MKSRGGKTTCGQRTAVKAGLEKEGTGRINEMGLVTGKKGTLLKKTQGGNGGKCSGTAWGPDEKGPVKNFWGLGNNPRPKNRG